MIFRPPGRHRRPVPSSHRRSAAVGLALLALATASLTGCPRRVRCDALPGTETDPRHRTAVAALAAGEEGQCKLTLTMDAVTNRASSAIVGRTVPGALVSIDGGIVPTSTRADDEGAFTLDVPLRPAAATDLRITALTATHRIVARRGVRQAPATPAPAGTVRGRVLDVATRQPRAGATVTYGSASARTAADGTFELAGVPDGVVAVQARLDDHLTGLALAEVRAGTGTADVLVQALAAPVTVGPEGGTFPGPGWSVEVPPGAVAAPTPLQLTPLRFTGPREAFGAPVVDLSPSGLRFAVPVTVTIDVARWSLDPATAGIVGRNPDTLATQVLPTEVAGDQVRVRVQDLDGQELLVAPGPRDSWGGAGAQCTPFATTADADRAVTYLREYLLPFLEVTHSATSRALYTQYLTPGTATMARFTVSEPFALDEFKTSKFTEQARDDLLRDLANDVSAAPPPLAAPDQPTTKPLSDYAPLGRNVAINYEYPWDTPGNIAGGQSGATIGGTDVPDTRDFDGSFKLVPRVTSAGVRQGVDLVADLTLHVNDAVDFCPGGLGAGLEANATVPLSRLEATPHPSGGTYAKPTLFEATTRLDPATQDVTSAYPTNDPDDDGAPDTQPWEGASFRLDNCPGVANPSQADNDGDGRGNECDDEDDEQNEPTDGGLPPGGVPSDPTDPGDGGTGPDAGPSDPGAASSWGDPHLVTFDHGAYDMQAAGDYVLARSASGDFEVQARYGRSSSIPDISFNRGLAARVGPSVIAFGDALTTSFEATLDGRELPTTPEVQELPGGATLRQDVHSKTVRWPDGTTLTMGSNGPYGTHRLTLAPSRWGQVRGLGGNANRDPGDDLTARDGRVVTDANSPELYSVFAASWRVEGDDSLFRTPMPADEVLPVVPERRATVASLDATARADAERICRERGLPPGRGLDACILDVALTGDPAIAEETARAWRLLKGSVDLTALGGTAESTGTISLGQRVSGSLDAAFATDVYGVDLAAGSNVRLSAPTCPGGGTGSFSATLVAPSGRVMGRTRGTGCGTIGFTQLREGGRYQIRVHDAGGFTGRYELLLAGQQLDTTCRADTVAPNDDGSGPEVDLPFEIDFFGRRYSSMWVNNNGNVTFDGPLSQYTPGRLDQGGPAMVAAWWADVDTRGARSAPVRYGAGSVGGRNAVCVDWGGVGYFANHDDKLNSFKLFIVDRGDVAPGAFDIVFQYQQLQWETGDASGGTGGLGGSSAAVGYRNGTGAPGTFLELPGSHQPGALLDGSPTGLTTRSTGSDEPGTHVFGVRPR